MGKVVIAIDSFKGCLDSASAGEAAGLGVKDAWPDAVTDIVLIADGGEGMSRAVGLANSLPRIEMETYDPLMRPVRASYSYDPVSRTAYIDMAAAAGLTLLDSESRNPMNTTTYGVGVMILDAFCRGASAILLGLGGSATNDAGLGALQALGLEIYGRNGKPFSQSVTGSMLGEISGIKTDRLSDRIGDVELRLACDVDSPFLGDNGAVAVFSPQKGASSADMAILEAGMRNVAGIVFSSTGTRLDDIPGSGAAGGMGGGFLMAGAEIRNGVEEIIAAVGLRERLAGACLCITGEGSADRQTLMGKAPFGVMSAAREVGIDTILVAGRISDRDILVSAGFSSAECINPPGDADMRPSVAADRIRNTVARVLKQRNC